MSDLSAQEIHDRIEQHVMARQDGKKPAGVAVPKWNEAQIPSGWYTMADGLWQRTCAVLDRILEEPDHD